LVPIDSSYTTSYRLSIVTRVHHHHHHLAVEVEVGRCWPLTDQVTSIKSDHQQTVTQSKNRISQTPPVTINSWTRIWYIHGLDWIWLD